MRVSLVVAVPPAQPAGVVRIPAGRGTAGDAVDSVIGQSFISSPPICQTTHRQRSLTKVLIKAFLALLYTIVTNHRKPCIWIARHISTTGWGRVGVDRLVPSRKTPSEKIVHEHSASSW